MRKLLVAVVLVVTAAIGAAQAAEKGNRPQWPTLSEQMSQARAPHGSRLEQLILENQDFDRLGRWESANDRIRLPLWLRVNWRKAHPEGHYSQHDPSGGYPLVLHEVLEWMQTHPNLEYTGAPELTTETYATGANVRLSGAQSAPRSESDIRVNYTNTNKIIGASNNISSSGLQAQWYSTDGGATWGQSYLSLQSGESFMSDPTVDWTSDGTAWSTTIGINSAGTVLKMHSYKSTNNGATWTFDNTFSGSQTSADKQMMWVDHSASSPYKDNIYVIYHNGNPAYIARRSGGVWQAPVQVSGGETTGTAIGADIKTNSAGDVFAMYPDTGSSAFYLVKSTNGGASWSAPQLVASSYGSYQFAIPADASRQVLVGNTIGAYRNGATNNVYAVFNDLSGDSGCTSGGGPGTNASSSCKTRIFFTRSTDGGTTWSAKVKINNQAGLNDQFFPWMVVDETNGKIGVSYYDTVGDSTRTSVNIYYQSSLDGGLTWTTPLKVSTATTNETTAGADSGNQFGDYTSLSGINGTFWPSWTDRRSGGSEEIWSAKVTDDSGTGCTPPAAPTGVSASSSSQSAASVSWSASTGATSYSISRGTTSGGPYSTAGSSTTTSFSDSGLACGTTYYYVVSASNGTCSSGNSAQASATTSACPVTPLQNGGFETGSLAPWTSTGTATVIAGAKHSGSFGAQVGATTPSTDSSIVQTFTMPAGSPTVSFWYNVHCPDTITYDWASATLKDNVTNTTATLLANTCTNTGAWAQVTYNASANAGHSVTLTLANHDDNYASDPTYTWYDDVTVSGATSTPTANFTFTTSGLTANFTDTSTDSGGSITSRSWNFGDGGTSTATNPSHTYTTGGTYTVSLQVTDNNSQTNSTSKPVTVAATCTPPAAPTGVTASSSSQTGASVSWSASTGATSYSVSRSTTSGGPYSAVGTSTTTSFTDSGLACGTTYYYVVSASNGTCSSGNSAQASAATAACSSGGPQNATYDATLKAPKCGTVGISCDSGASLLLGRGSVGPESNAPNTINNSCTDGTSGTFHSDESNDRLKVLTNNGTNFGPGKTVTVQATVWAWSGFTSDHLDLYYAANANSPTWVLIGTLTPTAAGAQTLSGTYTLPAGSLQAVRANFRYTGSASSCSTGSYDDHDDLVFAVGP